MLIFTPSESVPASAQRLTDVVLWAQSRDGQQVAKFGQSAVSALPFDPEVVLVIPLCILSWHRVVVPKVTSSRLRAALDGLLEEHVLTDTTDLHFALEPGGKPGQPLWVAVCDKAWLRSWLQTMETAARPVTRIVPTLWPSPIKDLVVHWAYGSADAPWLARASAEGVCCLPLRSGFSLNDQDNSDTTAAAQFLADPAVASTAEQVLDRRFEPLPLAGWLLRCAQSEWNLAQFEFRLSANRRRAQRWRQNLRHFHNASIWRPARWGIVVFVVVQLLGLNMAAWQERQRLDAKRQAVHQTLQETFPHVKLVLDASVQMQRELTLLQRASGQLGTRDLETMLIAVGHLNTAAGSTRLRYQPGELQLETPDAASLANQLNTSDWQARLEGGGLVLRPAVP